MFTDRTKDSTDVWQATLLVTLLQWQGRSAYIVSILFKLLIVQIGQLPTLLNPTGHISLHETFSFPFFFFLSFFLFFFVCV